MISSLGSRIDKKVILILVYRILLDWSYYYIISPIYNYMGLTTNVTPLKIFESYLLTVFVIILTPKNEERLSSIFLNIQLLVFLIPMLSLYGLINGNRFFIILVCMCHVLQCLILSLKPYKRRYHIVSKYYTRASFFMLLSITLISIILAAIKFGLPSFDALDLNKVYIIREKNVAEFPLSYFIPWIEQIILPFIAVYCLKYRKYIVLMLVLFLQLYFYLIFAQKFYLFALVFVVGVYYLKKWRFLIKGMYLGFPLLVFSTNMMYVFNHKYIMLPSLFVRRVLFVPAYLKFMYYDFFVQNPKVHFADGLIGKLLNIRSPYEKTVPFVISDYIGLPDTSCNTGYWGDAFANLGVVGVVIFSIFLAFLIYYIENKTKKMHLPIVVASFSLPLYSLNDGALLTALLSGGLLILIMLYLLLDMKTNIKYPYEVQNET